MDNLRVVNDVVFVYWLGEWNEVTNLDEDGFYWLLGEDTGMPSMMRQAEFAKLFLANYLT